MLQIEKLYIRDVKLGDDGFAAIASCVTNIEKLSIGTGYGPKLPINGFRACDQGILIANKPVSAFFIQ